MSMSSAAAASPSPSSSSMPRPSLIFFCALFGIVANVFNLGLIALLFLLIGSRLGFVVRHLFLALLLYQQLDGVANELRVPLDNLLDFLLLEVLSLVFLHVEDNLCTTAKGLATIVGANGEGSAST